MRWGACAEKEALVRNGTLLVLRKHPLFLPYVALGAVCFFWGTTYVAIRIALESIPPLFLVGARFTLSGLILAVGARLAGVPFPKRKDLLLCGLFGVLALGLGNGCLTYAELWIPSSLAALLVTTSPFWMVGLEATIKGGERLRPAIALGLAIGFGGTALLVAPDVLNEGWGGDILQGFLLLQFGCLGWSVGSIAQRRRVAHINSVMNGAIQQFAAGIVFLCLALSAGQLPAEWTAQGITSSLYLVVFGSIVGYTSYVYVLKKLPVAIVTLHVYVNPAVAVVLGWLFYREPFGKQEFAAMLAIFAGVAVVKRFGSTPAKAESPLRHAPLED